MSPAQEGSDLSAPSNSPPPVPVGPHPATSSHRHAHRQTLRLPSVSVARLPRLLQLRLSLGFGTC